MKIILNDLNTFKEVVSGINKLVNEITFNVTPSGLEVTAMDPANVAMVVMRMDKGAFKEYSGEGKFTINLDNLKTMLSRFKEKDAVVTLEIEDTQLKINSDKKKFTLPLIDDAGFKETKMPELKFKAEINADNSEIMDAINDVGIVSDSCQLKVEGSKFTISSSGDTGKVVSETKAGVIGEDCRSKYSLEYLNNMFSAKFKKVGISLSKDYPLKITYLSEDNKTSLIYILAPRIED